MYVHNYALTVYFAQGTLGSLASRDNFLVYQMEAWASDRMAFLVTMAGMLFGTSYVNEHPFNVPSIDVVSNAGNNRPPDEAVSISKWGTLSEDSKCLVARQHQLSATEAANMVHDLEVRGVAQTFLLDNYVHGDHVDWWGGLVAKYCS